MWRDYINAANLEEALEALSTGGAATRVVAGGTDLILELERGARKGITRLVDITRVQGLNQITLDRDGWVHLGPMVTHNQCVASKLIREYARPLAEACWEVGSPQIRNRGTIAGNLITASPANDTITPLTVLDAQLVLRSSHAERVVPISKFYTGVRRTVMQDVEMLVDMRFPAMRKDQCGTFLKYALRRAQAISLVNVAISLDMDAGQTITRASITFGAVAPTIIHTQAAE
ncbi:MAG TPA: FAD binding domain-containing protein, partial [Anaerolinea sp.]|nr:FAD binding domain-containing protein [Anaerolinea sp.]